MPDDQPVSRVNADMLDPKRTNSFVPGAHSSFTLNLRVEHELLFIVGRRDLNTQQKEKLLTLLASPLEWPYLVELADNHGLLELLHHHLTTVATLVPASVIAELREKTFNNSQKVLKIAGELLKLQQRFDECDLRFTTFKGAVLSQLAFGDIALRPAGDIDVLVSRANVSKAVSIAESLGFKPVLSLTPTQFKSHLEFHCEVPLVSEDGRTIIDLHWDLAPKSFVCRISAEDMLRRAKPVRVAGIPVLTFEIEDLLLYLAMHGSKHLWRRLEWIASLAALIENYTTIDWKMLIERSVATRTSRILALGMRLASQCFSVDVAHEVWTTLDNDEAMKRLASDIGVNVLFGPVTEPESAETALYNLKVMDRKTDAVVSMLRAVYTPTLSDFEAVVLPSSLHALYYAVRPLRLSKSYSGRFLRKLIGSSD